MAALRRGGPATLVRSFWPVSQKVLCYPLLRKWDWSKEKREKHLILFTGIRRFELLVANIASRGTGTSTARRFETWPLISILVKRNHLSSHAKDRSQDGANGTWEQRITLRGSDEAREQPSNAGIPHCGILLLTVGARALTV